MNNKSFVRKIIYIGLIGALLIPMSMVSRSAVKGDNSQVEGGGQLAQLRQEYSLSQAQMMDIDPASETMKLASLGLRGVAVTMLWMQANEHKKRENYDQLASTLKALIKIQPNFVKVWDYQAHNMAYNISMEFDDYEYRYHWVKKGISFLKDGIPYNRRDHRMTDHLGFFTGMKIGRSDERSQFRRMFRKDTPFHDEMSDYIDQDAYDGEYGHDNWQMAYWWYDISREMVEEKSYRQYMGDMLFYAKRPAQRRNYATSLQEEFKTDDAIQNIWQSAHEEWLEYGNRPITNTLGTQVSMESMLRYEIELDKLRAELDAMAPGVRETHMVDLMEKARITSEEKIALKIPADQRNEDQIILARRANVRMLKVDSGMIDIRVLTSVPEEDQMNAKRLMDKITSKMLEMRTIDQHNQTNNYKYWRARTEAEASDLVVEARKAMFDAEEMRRRSIFDDEYEIDFKTKEKINVRPGAISLYEQAFEKFAEVFDLYPRMRSGEMADDLVKSMQDYHKMLKISSLKWPKNFVLQRFIDERALNPDESDNLPTSQMVEDLYIDEEDDETGDDETGEVDPDADSEKEQKAAADKNTSETEQDSSTKKDDAAADGDKNKESSGSDSDKSKGDDQTGGDDKKIDAPARAA